jgi:GGDEF domain-containing protein
MSMDLRISKLEELVHRLAWNDRFGCYNRQGFEYAIWPEIAAYARWLIFFDLDHLHELNQQHESYAPVDAMIRDALAIVRKADYVCGQFLSGDEFILALTETKERPVPDRAAAEGLKARLVESLAKHGMSATFAIAEVKSWDLNESLESAVAEVKAAKKARGVSR